MKSKDNIQKDWQELLREKAGNVAGAQPGMSFAEIKEKMVAAAAEAGAGAGASAGSDAAGMTAGSGTSAVGDAAGLATGAGLSTGVDAGKAAGKRGSSWLKYAAAVAVIGAAGVMLLTDPWRGGKVSDPVAEAVKQERVTVVDEPVVEVPVEEAMPGVDDSRDETVPVDLTKLTAQDVASSNAPSGSLAQRAGKTSDHASRQLTSGITDNNSPDFGSTDTQSGTGSGTDTHSRLETRDAAEASNATPSGNTPAEVSATNGSPKQDPFTEPVKPLKKQLRRFSVGASGFLASNGIGSGKVRLNSMDYDMVTYTDNNGKLFYSYSAPSVRYNHSAPISGGISLRYNFTPVFYAESGLRLTYLHTWISPSGAAQNLLYAGIPLGVGANFAHVGNASFYASAYGMLSKCMMGHNSAGFPSNYSQLSDIPLMWSAGASLGASYNITRVFGLFAEPTVSYYFPTSNAPQTIYKENPWYFTLNLGVRFNLQ